MPNSKILIFGGTGQVGFELQRKLATVGQIVGIGGPRVDFSRADLIRAAVRAAEPAVIVNAAAYTAVDKAEREPELAAAVNGVAPGVLAEEAKRLGCLLVHYSTDYVFDGAKQGPYLETDTPNPLNVYGRTKLAGDEAILAVGGDALILRTTWVYGPRGSNFLLTMLRMAKERPELRIVDDQIGAPTSSEAIAQATAEILARILAPAGGGLQGRGGIYNLTCAGETSWFGFAKSFLTTEAQLSGTKLPNLIPIKTSEFPRPAKRPANSRLSCRRLEETFGVRMPTWEAALGRVFDTLREGNGQASGPA